MYSNETCHKFMAVFTVSSVFIHGPHIVWLDVSVTPPEGEKRSHLLGACENTVVHKNRETFR